MSAGEEISALADEAGWYREQQPRPLTGQGFFY